MRILFDLGHPAHAHFFRHTIADLQAAGCEIKIAAREREMLFYLLDKFGLDYTPIGSTKTGMVKKAADMIKKDIALAKLADSFKPDLMMATGSGSPYTAQVGKLKNIPSITCTDTEHAKFINWLTLPFSDIVCTPSCYTRQIRSKYHVSYPGYHELAYLHPDRFTQAVDVRKMLDIDKNENLILLKFARWTASHDLGVSGFAFKNSRDLVQFVKHFEELGTVLISSELPLPDAVSANEVSLPYELIHELIAVSDLYFGEGATMASEAAVLGVPAIFISNLRLGYLDELERKYALAFSFDSRAEAVPAAEELLAKKGVGASWKNKRKKMLKDKIDVSRFLTELILAFPRSIEPYRART